jgi:replicative DNA helicase
VESLTERAERAALGALLADPGHAARLDYLTPGDFASERHKAIFTAIARAAGEPGMSRDAYHAAVALAASSQESTAYLRELIEACPAPGHVSAYGAMVVQARLARELAIRAEELTFEAEDLTADGRNMTAVSGANRRAAEDLADHLEDLAAAFRYHAARLEPAKAAPGQTPAGPATLDQAPASPLEAAQQHAEERILSALLQRHPEAGRILDFLPAAAFTSIPRRDIFQTIRTLNATGRPVDPLTIDWELSQRTTLPVGGTEAYTTRLASTALNGESPLKAAYTLEARLQRRASTQAAPSPEIPARPKLALQATPEQPPPQPRLIQPPPGVMPRQPGPEQRM